MERQCNQRAERANLNRAESLNHLPQDASSATEEEDNEPVVNSGLDPSPSTLHPEPYTLNPKP